MRITFTGRQMEVAPPLRQFTEKRLEKLSRLLRDRLDIHVILSAEKHRRAAEITLKFRDQTLVGIEETSDARKSIMGALEKLERQAVRFFQRRRTQKRRHRPATAVLLNVLGRERADHQERRVLDTERIPIKPLTLEEAIRTADLKSRGVVIFRNPQTGRVNVLYRRGDGNLSLIEPETGVE